MANVLVNAFHTYSKHLELIAFSAVSLILAFVVPLLSPFPTYLDIGSTFIRTASVFTNLTPFSIVVIIASTLFSLLFLSFAIVVINLTVKYRKTGAKLGRDVIGGLERYTGNVFLVLFLFTSILMLVNIVSYNTSFSGLLTAIVGLILTPFLFYAPSAIVIDERRFVRAVQSSISFIRKRPSYLLIWIAITIVILSATDLIFMPLGAVISGYVLLFVDSIFVLPFILVLQSEMYINRFDMLKG